jgi:exopolysaccharide biosynthesis predicted pyruvyltransferase EpsI
LSRKEVTMDHKPRLELISKLDGMIHDCLKDCISSDESLAILDFPDIKNCGDSAIWLGELAWLKNRFEKKPSYVSRRHDFSASDLREQVPDGPIFIQGGGTFGDIYPGKQDFREAIMEVFPDRRVVQFPQSIHYNSQARVEQSARAIGRHKNFILVVRDQQSKEFGEKHFDCDVRLCPDMAFAIGPLTDRKMELPVLAMLREDVEKVDRGAWTYPDIPKEDWITESPLQVRLAKLRGASTALFAKQAERKYRMLDAAARQRFERGIRQISRPRAIVTDRLHVHICSLLLGRPQAVLDNNYGKIRGLMQTFYGGAVEMTYRATALDDGVIWAREQAAKAS